MVEKNSTKKKKSSQNKRVETEVMGSLRKVHKGKGCPYMFHLWQKGGGQWYACRPLYSKIGGGLEPLFPRGECPCPMLQMQHQLGGKPIYIRHEVGRRKGQKLISFETKVS